MRRAVSTSVWAGGFEELLMYRFVFATIVLVATAFAGIASLQSDRRVVRITAERFAFSPSEITLTVGEEVELRLESDDTAHGFHIPGTSTNVAIPKRGQGYTAVVLRFDQPGRHGFECSRMCGAGHNFMRGELVVRERATQAAGR
jgi:cytochrome c oxidase subunit 2